MLPIPNASTLPDPALPLFREAHFLTFNYTNTLEKAYGIDKNKILYIHGRADDPNSDIVLGHDWNPNDVPKLDEQGDEDADMRIIEGNSIVNSYFGKTFKPSEEIIKHNRPFFKSLSSVDHIYVLGHSLSDVDSLYFFKIKNFVHKHCLWTVTYYREEEKQKHEDFLARIGVDDEQINLILMKDL